MTFENQVNESVEFLQRKNVPTPEIAIVLGTGLHGIVQHIEISHSIYYSQIPNFPLSTVESHVGRLIFGSIKGKTVVAMQGRFHYYEGYSMHQVTLPIRVMKLLGAQFLLLSNASGALNLHYKKADLVVINDHINLQSENPLRGPHNPDWGPRFVDLSAPYSSKMNAALKKAASQLNILLHEGVYCAVDGPSLETRAEYRYLRQIGGDVVGMSTVPEVIVANQMQLPCAVVSVVTDECDPDNLKPVSIQEMIAAATTAETKLVQLFEAVIENDFD